MDYIRISKYLKKKNNNKAVRFEGAKRFEKCELGYFSTRKSARSKRTGFIILFVSYFTLQLQANNFTVAPKKKQSKITVEQICANMMPENIICARINSLMGHNQAIGLSWIDDIMEEEKNALFNLATQEQLQKFNQAEQEYIAQLAQFENVQQARREFLKQWKQEVLAPKQKK